MGVKMQTKFTTNRVDMIDTETFEITEIEEVFDAAWRRIEFGTRKRKMKIPSSPKECSCPVIKAAVSKVQSENITI